MRYLFFSFFFSACSLLQTKTSENILTDADKMQTFQTRDYNKLKQAFVVALNKDGYEVKSQDDKAGILTATADNTSSLQKTNSSFNSGFSGGANYKVSDSLRVTIKFTSTAAGYVANMLIQKIENFSMGQEAPEDLNDPTLYKSIFSKVNLEL